MVSYVLVMCNSFLFAMNYSKKKKVISIKFLFHLKSFKIDSEQRQNVKCQSLAWSETADIGTS